MIRVPACARVPHVSRVCVPGSRLPPVSFYRYCTEHVPVRVPAPPVSFYRYATPLGRATGYRETHIPVQYMWFVSQTRRS